MQKKKILVAPLNWGIGHATRCIPIIRELEKQHFEAILASDGQALELLKKEFPHLLALELPSYNIRYTIKGDLLKWKLLLNTPRILQAIRKEHKLTQKLVPQYELSGIISDNRFGVRSKKLKKNVFITHQLNVLSGNTSFLSSSIHLNYIKKFDECWIPDVEDSKNLSGILGHVPVLPKNVKYIGPLSRLEKREIPVIYDFLVLLSGPEPQRSILEDILLEKLKSSEKRILFVRGIIDNEELKNPAPNINIKNFLFGKFLQEAINCSDRIIARSGYTTIMDLAKLQKKAFFIPTPGQPEQEYLAERLEKLKMAPFCKQKDFEISLLEKIDDYEGLGNFGKDCGIGNFFAFFHGE